MSAPLTRGANPNTSIPIGGARVSGTVINAVVRRTNISCGVRRRGAVGSAHSDNKGGGVGQGRGGGCGRHRGVVGCGQKIVTSALNFSLSTRTSGERVAVAVLFALYD